MTEFEKLFTDNRDFIFKYLMKLSRDPVLSEELTQETFFRAYINFSSLKSKEKAPIWLCQIAKNTYFAWYNKQKKSDTFSPADAADHRVTAEETMLQKELSQQALRCLEELEEPYQEVFKLSVFGGIPLGQISAMFGKSESWARVTFYRAKQKLTERLRSEYEL